MLAGLGLVLIAGTACGQAATPGAVPEQTVSPTTSPPTSSPTPILPGGRQITAPEGSTKVPAEKIDATALSEDYPRDVSVTPDGRALYIRGEEGGCGRASAEVREETAQRVVVNLVENQQQLKGQMCTMDIRYPLVSVPLAGQLGDRTVVLLSEKRRT